jgi:ABC transporter substrate binding protein
MNRRAFLTAMSGSLLAAPLAAEAQPAGKVYRVGTLHSASREDAVPRIAALERGLADLGYVAGRNILFVHRYAHPQLAGVAELAAELVRAGVNVVVTATNPTTAAMMKATSTVPIVMAIGVEPVSAGFVAGMTRPGGGGVPIAVEKEKRRIFSVSWSSPTVPPWEGRTERRYADGQHATARGCEQAGLADRGRGGDANCGAERH